MIDPLVPLRDRILAATRAALGDEAAEADPALHRSQHADYQADLAMALARKLGKKPRELAAALAAELPADDVIAAVEISGPGFLNLTLRADYLAAQPDAVEMLELIAVFLRRWLPAFKADQRAYLTVAIGCTGGQHRSVWFAERLAERFAKEAGPLIRHRELREPDPT